MSPLVTIICSATGAAFVTGLMGIIAWALKRRAEKKDNTMSIDERMKKVEERIGKMEGQTDAIVAGVRSLLYSEIKDRARTAIADGFITAEDLEDLTRKHELYHGPLLGNGYLDALMEKVFALPVRE